MSQRKKWVLLIVAGVIVVAAGGVFYVWHFGRIHSPSAVLKETLTRANAGQYDEATENLMANDRELFAHDPKLLREVLDAITRKGTIKGVNIVEEQITSDKATVRFEIEYKDGDVVSSSERFKQEAGTWKHSLEYTHGKLTQKSGGPMPIPPPQQIAKDIELDKEYTAIPTSDVSLRLPAGSKLDPNIGAAFQPGLDLRINVTTGPGIGLEAASQEMAKLWKQPGHSLADRHEVTLGAVKGVFFDGTAGYDGNSKRVMLLILGNDKGSTAVTAMVPEQDAVVKLARDSLMSAKWDENYFSDSLTGLPYTIEPATGLKLFKAMPAGKAANFSESGQPQPMLKPGEAVFNIAYIKLPGAPTDRRVDFEKWITSGPPGAPAPKIDMTQPITVDALKGFEAGGIVDALPLSLFRYGAVLFKSDTELYRFDGFVALSERATFEPKFKEMVRSFKLK